nr:MAG TPA: hypothetical protein [Caudoviricetes sp.]DAV50864.1 MAG TPA: hypothetical protein [Caudoviricetes sp.]
MRKWERGGVCPCAPILFPSPFPPSRRVGGVGASAATLSVCNMPPVEHHPTIRGMRGRTPLAANDGGKTLHQIARASRRWEE